MADQYTNMLSLPVAFSYGNPLTDNQQNNLHVPLLYSPIYSAVGTIAGTPASPTLNFPVSQYSTPSGALLIGAIVRVIVNQGGFATYTISVGTTSTNANELINAQTVSTNYANATFVAATAILSGPASYPTIYIKAGGTNSGATNNAGQMTVQVRFSYVIF